MMDKLVRYNLELMTVVFVVVAGLAAVNWSDCTLVQQMLVGFMLLYTLHEWEESRYPGGFYRIFFSKCTIDESVSEERLHCPVAVYLLLILLVPFALDNVVVLAMVPLVLAFFEGFIHTAGIVIHQLKKPYSPGMVSAWLMFFYALVMAGKLDHAYTLTAIDWLIGVVITVASFFLMEKQFMKGAGITIKEFQTNMKRYMMGRIKGRKRK